MTYRGPTSTWPYTPLPPPRSDNIAPDLVFCHPFYGTGIIASQCERAAGRLPISHNHETYSRRPLNHQNDPYFVPVGFKEGPCQITVDLADSELRVLDNTHAVIPDDIRDLASRLISTCVNHSGVGGYGTLAITNMIDFLADRSTTDHEITGAPWPIGAMYFVVTLTSKDLKDFDPAFHDEGIAVLLADAVVRRGNPSRADLLALQADIMKRSVSPHGQTPWYEAFSSGSSSLLVTEMAYTCDAKLGAPSASDCNQLAYLGLGPPGDTIAVGPGVSGTRTLTFDTCNVVITALTSIILTWNQIQTSFQTLLDICVQHPLLGSRGGRAYPTNPSSTTILPLGGGNNAKRKRATPSVTGLNALPPGVILTVHSGNSWPYAKDSEGGLQRCNTARKRSVASEIFTRDAGETCFRATSA